MMDFNTPPNREPQYIPRAPQPKSSPAPPPQPQPTRPATPQLSPEPQQPAAHIPKIVKRQKRRKSSMLLKALVVVSLILISISGFLAYNYNNTKKQLEQAKAPTSVVGSSETDKLITEISKAVELPTGETPTLSTLQNIKAQSGTDYLKVQNGDKVLVYNNAGVAVFYRPSLKKVIFFTYLKSDNSASTSQPTNTVNNGTSSDTIQTNRPGQTNTQQP